MRRLLFGLLAVVAVASAAPAAPLFSVTNTTGLGLGNPPFTLGFQFTPTQSGAITALGLFDDGQNGLAESHAIGLFDSGGNLLASATVPSGTGAGLIDQFRYVPISPVNLQAGQPYTVGALFTSGADPLIFPGGATGFATATNITFNGSRFAFGGSLAFPGVSGGTDPAYFGPNALFSTPEPVSLAVFGGLIGVGGLVARRRTRATA